MLDVPAASDRVRLMLSLLVSSLLDPLGYAVVDVIVNGLDVVPNFVIPSGAPQDLVFSIPARFLVLGMNTVRIRNREEARSALWLYRARMDGAGASGDMRHPAEPPAATPVAFVFRTERRETDSTVWRPAPPLVLHLERNGSTPPADLSWRSGDGAETSIVMQPAMASFLGFQRAPDGSPTEYRGVLERSSAFGPVGAGTDAAHRFRTEERRDGEWRPAAELRLLIDDGGAPVERVTWSDQAGGSGWVSLAFSGERPVADDEEAVRPVAVTASGDCAIAVNLLDDSAGDWLSRYADGAWVQFALKRPAAVRYYALVSAADAPDRDPRDWTLKGSHDGRHWATLDRRSREVFADRHQRRGFTVASGTGAEYAHYRLEITRTAGAPYLQLSRLSLFTGVPTPPAEGFTGFLRNPGEPPHGFRGTSSVAEDQNRLVGPVRTAR
ncbi:alpha-1,2-mannosidase [Streptomyces sp. NPDC048281]|uniref:alpha-1,2-mannosidase n=1 Tax=Streptomyces sp. NPDC048281 TaxID=3154715 RepID=UPI003421894B